MKIGNYEVDDCAGMSIPAHPCCDVIGDDGTVYRYRSGWTYLDEAYDELTWPEVLANHDEVYPIKSVLRNWAVGDVVETEADLRDLAERHEGTLLVRADSPTTPPIQIYSDSMAYPGNLWVQYGFNFGLVDSELGEAGVWQIGYLP